MKMKLEKVRSFSVKNKNVPSSIKNLELGIYPKDSIKEENESVKDNLNESQEDIINEEDSDIQNVSNFQYYFELILSIIMILNSFFTYSYLNIIHIIYCFLLLYSRFTIEYNFWVKTKKTLMIILLIINCLYLTIKTIFFIIYAVDNEITKKCDMLFPFFIVGYEWKNYYDYSIVSVIIILVIVYLIIAELDEEFWRVSVFNKTSNILKEKCIDNNNILNFGLFYVTLGAAIYPSVVDLIILILCFLYFISIILNKKFRNIMKKYVAILIMFILPIYTILNYALNSHQIISKISSLITKLIFVDLFNNNNDDEEESEYIIESVIYTGCIPFLLFMKGFNEINLHLKCLWFIELKEKEEKEEKEEKKDLKAKKKHSFLSSFSHDDGNTLFNNRNERILSLTDSINNDKKKNKLQSIFNTNIDCGIIIFTKESSDVDIFTKIKMFVFKFCYTPAFILHICRISVILWINCYITYASIILIVWLFISINFSRENFFFIITKVIVFPLLIIIFVISYISNIRGTSFDSKFFGFIYYSSGTLRFLHMIIKFLIIAFFQIYIHLKTKHAKLLKIPEIREEIRIQEEELENVINHDLKGKYVTKPLELFFKAYFAILDCLLVVLFYLSITQSINIFNQLGLLFLISMFLLKNRFFKKYGIYVCLITLNISFLVKYIVHFLFPTMKTVNNVSKTEIVLSILFHDHLYNIHYYWITYYFLFLEYITQTSQLFKICNSKTISMHELIQTNLGTHNYIKLVLSTLTNLIFGVYIWLLIPGFVACLIMQDNNLIFLMQFLIIFFIYYKYIQIANGNYSNLELVSNIFKYTWTLIFSTILNLILIYVIQFLNKRPLSVFYSLLSFKTKKYLEVTGLFVFNGKYSRHMACFFLMFVLSVALHVEIGRQIKLNTKDIAIKNKVKKYSLSVFRNKAQNISVFLISQLTMANKNAVEECNIERKEKLVLKDSSNQGNINNIDMKKEKEKKENNIKKRKKEKIKATQIIYRLYIALYYILHYYWIIIFVFISIIAFHWMLSVSMALQLSLFCFYIGKSFKVYYNYYNKLSTTKNEILLIKEKINRHVEERLERFKTTSDTQQEYFKFLWFFTFAFIILSYLCAILLKIIKAFSITYPNKIGLIKTYKIVSAFMYILGFYSVNEDDSSKRSFLPYSWGYFVIIGLFSIRAYLSTKFSEIKTIYFNNHNEKGKKKNKNVASSIKNFDFNEIDLILNSNQNESNSDSIEEDFNDLNLSLNPEPQSKRFKIGFKNKNKEENIEKKNIKKRKLSFDFQKTKIGKKDTKEYLREKKLFIYCKDDFNINYKVIFRNKNVESSLTIQGGIKKFIELLVVILITINAILKCNIVSFILLILLMFTYSYDSLTTKIMFKISFLLLVLLVLQYFIFVTNISYYTNPFINNDVILYITEIIKLPWSRYIGYRWGTFLSLGTNRFQIISLWLDVAIILILYFYLEFFSYSIYISDSNKKIEKITAKYNKKFKELQTMNENEYKSFVRAMKVSYNIELKTNSKISEKKKKNIMFPSSYNRKMLELCYYFEKDNRYLDIIKSDSIKGFMKLKTFFYLSFHYILLLLILLISLINQGFIVLGYMSFSIFYLYKSHCFLKGRRWTLLNGIHTFMKPYLFIDIFSQFIFQIPLSIYVKNNIVLTTFFKIFGYVQIVDYSSREEFLDNSAFVYVFLKILSYFLILIQENIYVSYDFKRFILQYHYEYLQKAFIKGKLYSFLFNNYRVRLMNDRVKQRKEINETLNNILCMITKWNCHLRSFNEGNNIITDLYKATPKENEKKKGGGITVGQIVRKHWLISLALQIFESSFTVDDEHYNVSGDILKILKGCTVLNSELDDLIDVFERKNYQKYGDINNIKLIQEEKRKLKEKEKEKEKEKKKKKKKDDKNTNTNTNINSNSNINLNLNSSRRTSTYSNEDNNNHNYRKRGSLISIDFDKSHNKIENLSRKQLTINSNDIYFQKYNNTDEDDSFNDNLYSSNTIRKIDHSITMRIPQEKLINSVGNLGSLSNNYTQKNLGQNAKDKRNSIFCIGEEMSLSSERKNESIQLFDESNSNINNINNINNNLNQNNNNLISKSESSNNKYIKLDQPYDDMFFAHADYRELKEEIRQDFFIHYCSKKKIIFIIIKSVFNFFMENFEYTVYFFMILNHLIYGCASSIIFTFLVFILGIIQYPRPSKLFWKITLIYCTIIIFLKFILQLNVWNNFESFQEIIDIQNNPTSFFAVIGIYKLSNYAFLDFFYYVIFDFLVLTSLIINQFILIRKGLWYMTEIDYETIEEANDRIIKYNRGKRAIQVGLHINSEKILTSNEIIKIIGKVLPPKKGSFKKIISKFFSKNFSHVRNEKPGKDFYIEYTIFQIFILIYIIFLYTKMERDQEIFNLNIFSLKQFSGHMALCAFVHVVLIVFDRFIYLKNTRKLKKIEFKIYNKRTGEDVTPKYRFYTYLDVIKKLNENDFEIVTYQYEGCQTGLLMKFGLQITTVLFIHIFIFFYFPYYGVIDKTDQLNKLSNNIFIALFYLLYIFYLVFSGLQIKYGLSDLRKMSGLMKSSNLLHSVFYKVFKAIPFLYELKNFIDWTFTTTSLDLWKWLKLEEIISLLYINKCFAKGNMERRIGTKIPVYMKLLMGGSIFFAVLLIVFGPIFLFSSLNPTNEVYPVIGVNLKVLLQIPPNGNDNQKIYELTLLDTHNSQIRIFSSDIEYKVFSEERTELKSYASSFKYKQVQRVKIFGLSETNWDISPLLLNYLKDNIKDTLNISIMYSFVSQGKSDSSNYYGNEVYENVDNEVLNKIYDLVFNQSSTEYKLEINMTNAYSPYQKLQESEEPIILIKKKIDAILCLRKQMIGNNTYFNWNIYSKVDNNEDPGLEFITFSDFYSSFTFGMDVITFYVSFVVVVGNILRGVFLGQSERIMYAEMVNPVKLFSVCEGIKIARIKKDFLQEEKLYYLLIDFMRSPEMFKNLTLSSLIYIQDNNIGKEEIKYREYEVESKALISSKKFTRRIASSIISIKK